MIMYYSHKNTSLWMTVLSSLLIIMIFFLLHLIYCNNKGPSPSNGYAIFGNKSYSYIDSQISVHQKHEIIEQSGI